MFSLCARPEMAYDAYGLKAIQMQVLEQQLIALDPGRTTAGLERSASQVKHITAWQNNSWYNGS